MGRIRPTLNGSQLRGATLTLDQKAALAQKYGYPGLDFSLADARSVDGGPGAVPALLARRGVEASTVSGVLGASVVAPEEQFEAALAAVPANAREAAAAGGRRTGTVLPCRATQPREELWPLVVERVRRIDAALDGSGVRLGMEFLGVKTLLPDLPHPFVQSMTESLRLLDEAGARHVGLTLDSYHWHAAGDSLDTIRRTAAERLVLLHVNDARDLPRESLLDGDRLVPGEGVIPLTDWLRAIASTGFDGYIAMEVLGPRLADVDADACARLGMEVQGRLLAAAGLAPA
jgi:sugar phosphate isomerase/epimerase